MWLRSHQRFSGGVLRHEDTGGYPADAGLTIPMPWLAVFTVRRC